MKNKVRFTYDEFRNSHMEEGALGRIAFVGGILNAVLWTALWRLTDMPRDLNAGMSLITCAVFALALARVGPQSGSAWRSPAGRAVLLLGATYILSSGLVHLAGYRSDNSDMWRQIALALLPAVLFFGYFKAGQTPLVGSLQMAVSGVLLLCAASIGLEIAGVVSAERYGTRYFGFLSDGVAWLLSFCAVFFLAVKRPVQLALSVGGLIATQARGAIIVAAIGAVLLASMSRGGGKRTGTLVAVITLGLIAVVGFIVFEEQINSVFQRMGGTDIWNNDRVWTINLSLILFEKSPLFGMGYNAQPAIFTRDYLTSMAMSGWSTPVSTFFQVLADGGLIAGSGFVIFASAIGFLCVSVLRSPMFDVGQQASRGVAAWLFAFIWANHSAAWLIPGSMMSPLVFASAGLLAGRTISGSQRAQTMVLRNVRRFIK